MRGEDLGLAAVVRVRSRRGWMTAVARGGVEAAFADRHIRRLLRTGEGRAGAWNRQAPTLLS